VERVEEAPEDLVQDLVLCQILLVVQEVLILEVAEELEKVQLVDHQINMEDLD
jgi:hypothetical protein